MSASTREDRLARTRRECAEAAAAFHARHRDDVDGYRRLISDGIDAALDQVATDVAEVSGGDRTATELAERTCDYARWMQWALWDLPVFAVALRPPREAFQRDVTACGLLYTAIRLFDDAVDQHHYYKGRHRTLLGVLCEDVPDPAAAAGRSTLAGLLLAFEGVARLAASGPVETLATVVGSLRRAVIGAMMEGDGSTRWTVEDYQRLVRLKNVDYWRALYAAVDPGFTSPLYGFLERYAEVAQYLNDVGDHPEDLVTGQPNLLTLSAFAVAPGCRPVDGDHDAGVPDPVVALITDAYLELADVAARLPEAERLVARTKLAESLDAAAGLGILGPPERADADRPPAAPRIYWYSDIDDVVAQAGVAGLAEVACGVCGSTRGRVLFRKQGFPHLRCEACSHVYVSPRISADLHRDLVARLDDLACEDPYLEVQRVYAESICDLLRRRAPGPRLLDVGFGRGYLLQMGQLYGFEAHGIDGSPAQVEAMRPQHGARVVRAVVGVDPVPWDGFDVVTMSHVLEHLPDPADVLGQLRARMNPDAWLYAAVPDAESLHFRLFGKRWDAVTPLAHLHHFTEPSLTRLLERCGFDDVERVHHPAPPDAVAPRWMRFMRQLGGSESSELVLLARAPGGDRDEG